MKMAGNRTVAAYLLIFCMAILSTFQGKVVGMIQEEVLVDKNFKITGIGEKILAEMVNPLKIATIVGEPKLNAVLNNALWTNLTGKPVQPSGMYTTSGSLNITAPEGGDLVSIHYDLTFDIFRYNNESQRLADAKVPALAMLMSNHIVYTRDTNWPNYMTSEFGFLSEKIIPALILYDLVAEKRADLLPLINWPTIWVYVPNDPIEGYKKEVLREYRFPVWKWPSIKDMLHSGHFGYKESSVPDFSELLKNEEIQYYQLTKSGMIPVERTNIIYSPVPQKFKLLEGLLELTESEEFRNRYKAKTIEEREVLHKYFEDVRSKQERAKKDSKSHDEL